MENGVSSIKKSSRSDFTSFFTRNKIFFDTRIFLRGSWWHILMVQKPKWNDLDDCCHCHYCCLWRKNCVLQAIEEISRCDRNHFFRVDTFSFYLKEICTLQKYNTFVIDRCCFQRKYLNLWRFANPLKVLLKTNAIFQMFSWQMDDDVSACAELA